MWKPPSRPPTASIRGSRASKARAPTRGICSRRWARASSFTLFDSPGALATLVTILHRLVKGLGPHNPVAELRISALSHLAPNFACLCIDRTDVQAALFQLNHIA